MFKKTVDLSTEINKAMDEGTDKDLYKHAVDQKGQNFYNDIGSAHKSLNVAPEAQKENEQPVLSNNKTLNKSNKTLSN